MSEAELIAAAKEIAEKISGTNVFANVEYIDEGELEGEPASICIMLDDGRTFALGVLPL